MTESKNLPVAPGHTSTLILMRGKDEEFQVYLLKRSDQSGFMPGKYVFSGGRLLPLDPTTPIGKSGRRARAWQKGLPFGQAFFQDLVRRRDLAQINP